MSINDLYLDWMVDICHASNKRELMETLNSIAYTYQIPMDGNRYDDGINLRYIFGDLHSVSPSIIARELDVKPCSVLEMMLALAIRLETHILSDPDIGDRTYIWFNEMLESLDLDWMTDKHFSKPYAVNVIYKLLNRDYAPNGKGGLFTVNGHGDLRKEEIWYQAMWYLSSKKM